MAQQSLRAVPGKNCLLVNDKPYPTGMWFEWNDRDETLEIRYNRYDYATRIMPVTVYSEIDLDGSACPDYQTLVVFITNNAF
jgi:hypothetical protein